MHSTHRDKTKSGSRQTYVITIKVKLWSVMHKRCYSLTCCQLLPNMSNYDQHVKKVLFPYRLSTSWGQKTVYKFSLAFNESSFWKGLCFLAINIWWFRKEYSAYPHVIALFWGRLRLWASRVSFNCDNITGRFTNKSRMRSELESNLCFKDLFILFCISLCVCVPL